MKIESWQLEMLNQFQKGFPVCSRPFLKIAEIFQKSEDEVLETFSAFQKLGLISRIGAVLPPNRHGASTLAAIQIAPDKLEEATAFLNSLTEVNHNYERENELNIWFVATAPSEEHLVKTLALIENRLQSKVHDLRLKKEFRIDLGFPIQLKELHA